MTGARAVACPACIAPRVTPSRTLCTNSVNTVHTQPACQPASHMAVERTLQTERAAIHRSRLSARALNIHFFAGIPFISSVLYLRRFVFLSGNVYRAEPVRMLSPHLWRGRPAGGRMRHISSRRSTCQPPLRPEDHSIRTTAPPRSRLWTTGASRTTRLFCLWRMRLWSGRIVVAQDANRARRKVCATRRTAAWL
jgi:hypothetical protein